MGSERNERPQSDSEMTPASRARSSGPSSGVPPVPTPAVLNEPVTGQKAAPGPNDAGPAKNSGPPEATGPVSRGPNPLRAAFGALLFEMLAGKKPPAVAPETFRMAGEASGFPGVRAAALLSGLIR